MSQGQKRRANGRSASNEKAARTTASKPKRRARQNEPASSARDSGRKKLPLYAAPKQARKLVPCTSCALCCTYLAIEVDAPTTPRRATELLWYLYHEGVSLYENGGDWMVQFESACKNLLSDGRCGIYETRPHICREYDETGCEVNTEDDGRTFYEPAELMAYLEKHKRRVYAELKKSYAPPPAPVGNLPPPSKRPSFKKRFERARALSLG